MTPALDERKGEQEGDENGYACPSCGRMYGSGQPALAERDTALSRISELERRVEAAEAALRQVVAIARRRHAMTGGTEGEQRHDDYERIALAALPAEAEGKKCRTCDDTRIVSYRIPSLAMPGDPCPDCTGTDEGGGR